jgi:hypothetical protein
MHRLAALAALAALIPAAAHATLPTRTWATYLGGPDVDSLVDLAIDGAGHVYACGRTAWPGIGTPGTHQPEPAGGQDGYLLKLAPDGTRVWGTYLGGPGADDCRSVVVAPGGDVVVAGITTSNVGIATPDAFLPTMAPGFVMRLDADGQRVWGTYAPYILDLSQSPGGELHLVGDVYAQLPFALPDAHQPDFAGVVDAVHLVLSLAGALVRGTYYGGSGADFAQSIAAHAAGVDLGLSVASAGLATPGAHQPAPGGGYDVMVVRLDAAGARQWATYLGGADPERVVQVAATADGVVLSMMTLTPDLASPGAYQSSLGGKQDVLVARFDAAGVRQWATYLGGPEDDPLVDIALDPAGNVLVAGATNSPDLATPDALYPAPPGPTNALVVKFDPGGARRWSTYYGDAGVTSGGFYNRVPIAVTGLDTIHLGVSSSMGSGDLATPGTFQPLPGGGHDGVIVRLAQDLGLACAAADDCETGLCVDGVCCDASCGGSNPADCRACSVAAGASADGVCAVLSAASVCRPAAGECDAPELCPGDAPTCPIDQAVPDATPCADGSCAGRRLPRGAGDHRRQHDPTRRPRRPTRRPSTGETTTGETTTGETTGDPPTPTTGDPPTGEAGDATTGDATTGDATTGPAATGDGGCGCASAPVPRDISLLAPPAAAAPPPALTASRDRDPRRGGSARGSGAIDLLKIVVDRRAGRRAGERRVPATTGARAARSRGRPRRSAACGCRPAARPRGAPPSMPASPNSTRRRWMSRCSWLRSKRSSRSSSFWSIQPSAAGARWRIRASTSSG